MPGADLADPQAARADLLELLEAACAHPGSLTVVDAGGRRETTSFAAVWARSARVARGLRHHAEPGVTIGAVLSTSVDCTAAIVGVLRGGWTLASLPGRARAMGVEEHARQLAALCELAAAQVVVHDPAAGGDLGRLPVPVLTYAELGGEHAGGDLPHGGRLVQFTSGSTADPKGIVLGLDRIAVNVRALLAALDITTEATVCSWLPLSHDMGLIGAFLSAWAAGASLTLLDPRVFVGDPSSWMRACAETGATHTWGPNFGYALATRAARGLAGRSLASLRVCVIGAEPIQAPTLRAFASAMAPLGFDERALAPGYGLAEATLGVTAKPLGETWRSRTVDAFALGAGQWAESEAGTEIVAVGRPLPGIHVRLEPAAVPRADTTASAIAEIQVAGSSLLEGYLGAKLELVEGTWLRTGDLGAMVDGELFVTGRRDDLLIVAGRNLYARDLELAAAEHPALRTGSCVAAQRTDGRYVIVAEHRADALGADVRDAERWIQRELTLRFGAAPAEVAIIVPGALPKTPSGKLARRRTVSLYEQGALARAS